MKSADIRRVAEAAAARGLQILEHYLPGGKRQGKEYLARNPQRDDAHVGSLSIEIASGKGADFATGDTFGDYVGMVAWLKGCAMGEAAEDLARFLGLPATSAPPVPEKVDRKPAAWVPVVPVPDVAPAAPQAHPTRGKPSAIYTYRDDAGRLLGYVCRWDATPTGRKEFSPLTYCSNGRGRFEWRWQGWGSPRPLCGLDLLAARPQAVVVLCEGEKATDAARKLLPDHVVMCWPNGANAADKVDWPPLKGRTVILWPDNDEPGEKAMRAVAKALRKIAEKVSIIDVGQFRKSAISSAGHLVQRAGDLPAGWDAADALAEGWTPAALADLLQREGVLLGAGNFVANREPAAADAAEEGGPYRLTDDGLYFVEYDKEGGKARESRICSPLRIPALARDGEGAGWAPVLEFKDRDGQWRREVIPCKLFIGQGHDGIKLAVDLGLEVESGIKALDRLRQFIVGARPDRRARLVPTTGWHGHAFVFPDGAVGEGDGELLLFDGSRRAHGLYSTRGTLANWRESIAARAVGNPRLMFALAAALAGPLLKWCGSPGFAFHFCGDSSTGKSAALVAGSSIWGPPESVVHTWRATSNAIETVFAQANDTMIPLDELREVDPREAGAIVYMQGNRKGKTRSSAGGGLREAATWRTVMLSSGEIGLSDHLAAAGQKHYAGQEVRLTEIEANAGAGLGMWNDVTGFDGGKEFSDALKKAANRYHGTAGRAFVAELIKNLDDIGRMWRQHDAAFSEDYKPANAGGQVLRVMAAFSLVGFAGDLAAAWKIAAWPAGAASEAAGALFDEWAKNRPTKGNSEDAQIIRHVRSVLERTWQSKFVDWHRATGGDSSAAEYEAAWHYAESGGEEGAPIKQGKGEDLSRMPQIIDPLGFRKRDGADQFLFYVTRGRFEEEFAAKAGFKAKRVAALLKARGVLRCDADAATYRETLPNGDTRSYCIIGQKLWALEA